MNALRLVEGSSLLDEAAAIAGAADGDPQAREWLVRRWTPTIWRFCARMVGDDQDAADITQEVMLRVLRSLDRYDPSRSFSTWIFGIARNACIDEHRRRQHRRTEALDDVADPAESALTELSREERARRLRQAVDDLPPMYREVLILFHFEHLKYTEIAEALNLPLGTVMNRIFRARQRVRALLEGEAP